MSINRDLYRAADRLYREWNQAKAEDQARHAAELSPTEAWRQYVALVEFCWQLSPRQSDTERAEKMAMLERYTSRVRQMETWRERHGQRS